MPIMEQEFRSGQPNRLEQEDNSGYWLFDNGDHILFDW